MIDEKAIELLGQDNVDKIEGTLNDIQGFFEDAYALINQDSQHFIDKAQIPPNKLPLPLPDTRPPSIRPNIFAGQVTDPLQISDGYDKPIPTNTPIKNNIFMGGVIISNDVAENRGVSDATKSRVQNSQEPQNVVTDPIEKSFQIIDGVNFPIQKLDIKGIANYIVEFTNALAIQNKINPIEAITTVIDKNPQLIQVSKELNQFYASKLPATQEYIKVASVYNGRNLTMANAMGGYDANGNYQTTLVDEVYDYFYLPETKGFSLPTIWGNFVGPYSKNNRLPIDILDLFCAFHDKDYLDHGFFDTIGDYKLMSRISQNYDRISEEARPAAKVALLWFSTLGVSAGALIGSLPKNISRVPVTDMPKDDIYYAMDPAKAINTPIEKYMMDRTQWYAELENELKSVSISSSVMTQYGSGNAYLAREFGNIMVEVM